MQLNCPHCRSQIAAGDINVNLLVAKCAGCGNVFSFADSLDLQPHEKPLVERPERFHVENWGPELTITYRWYTHVVWVLILFCSFWDFFLVAFYWSIFSSPSEGKHGASHLIAFLFPIFHLAVGAGLTYLCLAMLLNRTTIRVSGHQVTVSSGPIPFGRAITVQAADIRQLYCVKKEHRNKHTTSYTYDLHALLRDGVTKPLVKSLQQYEQARFLEQELEQHLKIVDERVGAEAYS